MTIDTGATTRPPADAVRAAPRRRGVAGLRRQGGRSGQPARIADDRPAVRRPHPAGERARAGEDHRGPGDRRLGATAASSASSARRTCCPATSSAPRSTTRRRTPSSPNSGRCTPTSCLLDEINRIQRQDAKRDARGDGGTSDHHRGHQYPIPEPFLVIATQNPVDQEGTYPLSEAQTDRFMLKEVLRYPSTARRGRGDARGWTPVVYDKNTAPGRWSDSTTSAGCSASSPACTWIVR